jgi:hypothetical protein
MRIWWRSRRRRLVLASNDYAVIGAAHVVNEFRRTGSVPREVVSRIQAKALLRGVFVPTIEVERRTYAVLERLAGETAPEPVEEVE